jgi:hypothetical protein
MPKASALWLTVAGAFAGVAVERHDQSALPYAALALVFFLVHQAVNRANQCRREDIVNEMELYEPKGGGRRRD